MVSYPPPPVSRRSDGVTLHGRCGGGQCRGRGTACQLVAQRQADGSLRLSYHGTAEHSMVLTPTQEAALAGVLRHVEPKGG